MYFLVNSIASNIKEKFSFFPPYYTKYCGEGIKISRKFTLGDADLL